LKRVTLKDKYKDNWGDHILEAGYA